MKDKITGAEVNMVVKDSLEALKEYKSVFDLEVLEETNLSLGENEAVFLLHGMRFHLLDENIDLSLIAPVKGELRSIWFNIVVRNIENTYQKAVDANWGTIQEITDLPNYGLSNAIVTDNFGYTWLLHEVKIGD